MRLLFAALAFAATLLPPAQVHAQTVGGIVVGDSTARPLAHVRVTLLDSATHQALDSTLADSLGVFYLTAPKAGAYVMRFARPDAVPKYSVTIRLAADAFEQRRFSLPEGVASTAYSETEVDRPTSPFVGNPTPRYPVALRDRNVIGNVFVHFVVDTTGYVVPGSLRIVFATAPDFADAVRDVAQRWRFYPAQLRGVPVRQVACMPIGFRVFGAKTQAQLDSQMTAWRSRGRSDCPPDDWITKGLLEHR